MNDQKSPDVSDVEFTEVTKEPEVKFLPASYVCDALERAGYASSTAWLKDIDLRAEDAEDEKERIFFTNRALRLFLSEQKDCDNISIRLLIVDGINKLQFSALIDQGFVPFLMELQKRTAEAKAAAEEASVADATTPAARGESPLITHIDDAGVYQSNESSPATDK